MKRIIIVVALLAVFIDAKAQGISMRNDTTFMGFRLDHTWDTVAEGDQYYMFPAHPDSGLHFMRKARWYHQMEWYTYTDSLGNTVTEQVIDTFPEGGYLEFFFKRIGQKYHVDSTVQIYGIAATILPTKYVKSGLRTGKEILTMTEFREPLDFDITQFQYELLRKSFNGTDSVMTVIDYLKLDSTTTIKQCWFRYDIDSTDTEKFVREGPANTLHEYYPGQSEVVVPCYEFYFDKPFDSIYTLIGDFYVGRTNFYNPDNMGNNHYYKDEDIIKYYYTLEYCPFFYDLDSADATFIWYDTLGHIIEGDTATATIINPNSPIAGVNCAGNGNAIKRPWGLIFPITGLRCKQLHNVHIEEKGDYYVRIDWQAGDDEEPEYQIQLVDRTKESGSNVIVSDTLTDSTYMFPGLDEYGKYDFRIRKSCHYASTHYDTIVWSDWHTLSFVMKEMPPVDTTQTDTTGTDTTQIDTTGIRLALGDADFSLRPNPARGSAELRLQYPVAETAELTLYDMRGREVRRMTLRRGDKRVRLDLDGLPAGAYLLKLLTTHGLAMRRLLVQ